MLSERSLMPSYQSKEIKILNILFRRVVNYYLKFKKSIILFIYIPKFLQTFLLYIFKKKILITDKRSVYPILLQYYMQL